MISPTSPGRQLLERDRIDDARVDAEDRDAEALQLGALGRIGVARRGRLGEPVALGEGQAELLLQPLGDGERHRRAAAADAAQARQVEALVVGAAEEVDHHRRDAGPVRDAVLRDEPAAELAIPARHEDDGRAGVHRAEHAVEHAGDVEHRHDAEADRLRAAGEAPLAADDVVHQGAMRVHAAFRHPGRSRRVGQERQIVRLRLMRPGLQSLRQRFGPARAAGRQRRIGAQPGVHRRRRRVGLGDGAGRHRVDVARRDDRADALAFGQRCVGGVDDRRQVGAADHDLGAGIGDVVLELLGAVHRVDRHHDRVRAQDRVQRDRKLRAVLHEDGDPVAGLDARFLQPAGQRDGVVAHLPVGQGATEEEIRGAVGEARRRDLEVEPERRLRRDHCAGQPPRPDREVRPVGGNLEFGWRRHGCSCR